MKLARQKTGRTAEGKAFLEMKTAIIGPKTITYIVGN